MFLFVCLFVFVIGTSTWCNVGSKSSTTYEINLGFADKLILHMFSN